jgi:hypothetical protein
MRFVDIKKLPPSVAEKILERMKYWKATIENVKDFTGTSPPSVFIGSNNYPKVFMGILSPPEQKKNAYILDSPEKWYQQKSSLDQILNFRGQLIYSRFQSSIKNSTGKFIEVLQELAMAKKQADIEVELKKKPKFRFDFDSWITPIGNPAPIEKVELVGNPKIERNVDYLVSDVDIKAQNAVQLLYKSNIPLGRIQKILSAGLLGVQIQRKFVPTRWSITAVDDILGKNLMENVRNYQELDEIRLFNNEYLGNHYEILLIPGVYQYELIEAKLPKSVWNIFGTTPAINSDYEPFFGRKAYANQTAGAFYAGRLAVLEYLEKIRKQAAILIVREVRSDYFAPVGIWQLRETVRDAFNKPFEKFDSLDDGIKRIAQRLIIKDRWASYSKLLKEVKEQKRITQFSKIK